jgi:Fe(3+) dicitrate transport protein
MPLCRFTFASFFLISLNKMRNYISTLFMAISVGLGAQTEAEQDTSATLAYLMPEIPIVGEKPRLLGNLPGSAGFVNAATLKALSPINGNEALRTIAGLQVVEEEGLGLRANIGIRGLDPDRSSRVLILEDGIPVALNPFGEPQLYYTPQIDRMEALEVLKGSGQILFGPQTIGGVVNYITAAPPKERMGRLRLQAGAHGFFSSLLSFGNTVGNTGFRVDYLRKQADHLGHAQFRVNDLNAKMVIKMNDREQIRLKLGLYDEHSDATYLGLTQGMFDLGGQDFVRLSPDDQLEVRRISGSVAHEYRFSPRMQLRTTAFAYTTERNWRRQDFSRSSTASNQTGIIWGDPTLPGGAIYMRNGNGHRDRQFGVAGIESNIQSTYDLGKATNKVQAGLRYLYERADEQRVNGTRPWARAGALMEDERRSGNALSAFVHNALSLGRGVSITAGLRAEQYFYGRDIARQAQRDTQIISHTAIFQLIPGLGINFSTDPSWTLFAGLHRGFAPPRVKDAITNAGVAYNLDPELSWNSELGMRAAISEALQVEFTGFVMDFSNQIIPISESSGGAGSGLINGGESRHTGVEAALQWSLGSLFLPSGNSFQLLASASFVDARYTADRFIGGDEEAVNIRGNHLPYAPQWLYSATAKLDTRRGFGANIVLNGQSRQYTDELNSTQADPSGETGIISGRFTLDGNLSYQRPDSKWRFFASVKNMTNERFIATRRPQGIRVNLPRFISGGLEFTF